MPRRYTKHLIQGKTVKQIASELGVSIITVYAWIRDGTLDSHMNKTYVRKRSGPTEKIVLGKTYKEWAKELGLSIVTVRSYSHNVYLERCIKAHKGLASGERPKRGRIVFGKSHAELARQLGVSREYIRQLDDNGKLMAKINQHKENQ